MATVGANYLTVDEIVKRSDESAARTILEVAKDNNAAIRTFLSTEGNKMDGNMTVARTTYPPGTWTSDYEGVSSSTSHTKEVLDSAGTLETYSAIAKRTVHRTPDRAATRMQEDVATTIGMSQEMEDTFFNGNKSLEPKEFTGLLPRYNSTTAETGDQIKLGGATGDDVTSIWFVTWDPMAVFTFYGANGVGGLEVTDKGIQSWDLAGDGTHIEAYVNHFSWNMGLAIANWKGVARVANLDVSLVAAGTTTLAPLMIDAYLKIPSSMQGMRKSIYCNNGTYAALWKEAQSQTNNNLTMQNWEGSEVTHFNGIPITRTDKIGVVEDVVS